MVGDRLLAARCVRPSRNESSSFAKSLVPNCDHSGDMFPKLAVGMHELPLHRRTRPAFADERNLEARLFDVIQRCLCGSHEAAGPLYLVNPKRKTLFLRNATQG